MKFKISLFLLTIILFYNFFYLIPNAAIFKAFNFKDIGLLVVFVGTFFLFFPRRNKIHINSVSILIVLYLLLVFLHVALATLNYDQSLIDGFIAARNQLSYVSFFMFLFLIFDSKLSVQRCLDALTVLTLFISLFSILDYFGLPIFHHYKYSDWEVYRGGILRVFIPCLNLVHVCLVWSIANWAIRSKIRQMFFGLCSIFFWGMLFFHQSRGQIISLAIVTVLMLISAKKYRLLLILSICFVMAISILELTMKENIVTGVFSSSIDDIQEGSGTVKGRLSQIFTDINEFKEHPILGSGLVAVRISKFETTNKLKLMEMEAKVRKVDLGYSHLLKMYGAIGVFWLLILFTVAFKYCKKIFKYYRTNSKELALFCFGHLMFIVISGITLNHFIVPDKILLFSLLLAILSFLSYDAVKRELPSQSIY